MSRFGGVQRCLDSLNNSLISPIMICVYCLCFLSSYVVMGPPLIPALLKGLPLIILLV